ncbi:MAG: tRNA pseudouridine(55) synthase, partial [Candidatus Kapaibacteriota bacterium]
MNKSNLDKFEIWFNYIHQFGGALLIDKPKDWTSFDVVNKLKRALKIQKVGHTGTLDPFATGLLIILFNKYTKKQQEFTNLDKTYIAQIKLGATTKTYDITSAEENTVGIDGISQEIIIPTIKSFEGIYEQVPPIFSAKKISGQRAYILARKNLVFEPRP